MNRLYEQEIFNEHLFFKKNKKYFLDNKYERGVSQFYIEIVIGLFTKVKEGGPNLTLGRGIRYLFSKHRTLFPKLRHIIVINVNSVSRLYWVDEALKVIDYVNIKDITELKQDNSFMIRFKTETYGIMILSSTDPENVSNFMKSVCPRLNVHIFT